MSVKPIGLVIKEIATEKNLKVSKLAELSGKSRQGIYVTFGRSEMSDEELGEWAKALGVTKDYLFDRWKTASAEDNSFGANVLGEIKRMIEEELREKNEQIRSLQESLKDAQAIIKMAMGKLDPASDESKVKEMWPLILATA